MRMKLVLGTLIILALVVAVIVVISIVFLEENKLVNGLTSNVWIGTQIEMPGFASSTREVFGGDLKLTLQKNGRCLLELPDQTLKASWKLKGNTIRVYGKGLDTRGNLTAETPPVVILYDVENYAVFFYNELYF